MARSGRTAQPIWTHVSYFVKVDSGNNLCHVGQLTAAPRDRACTMAKHFFDEAKEQSEVKSAIVRKYFKAWATAIKGTVNRYGDKKIAYLHLFAGPGRYKDGTISTPLLVLQEAIADKDLRRMLVTLFNDKDEANCRSLEKAINDLPGVETLKHKPEVDNDEVGTEMVKLFEEMNLVPTLFFVDPWGYKGLSLKLINSVHILFQLHTNQHGDEQPNC
jgi:hypothetical protein